MSNLILNLKKIEYDEENCVIVEHKDKIISNNTNSGYSIDKLPRLPLGLFESIEKQLLDPLYVSKPRKKPENIEPVLYYINDSEEIYNKLENFPCKSFIENKDIKFKFISKVFNITCDKIKLHISAQEIIGYKKILSSRKNFMGFTYFIIIDELTKERADINNKPADLLLSYLEDCSFDDVPFDTKIYLWMNCEPVACNP